jgi:hypothetical protein
MVVEQAILEEGSQNASEGQDEHSENNSVDKVIDNADDATAADDTRVSEEQVVKIDEGKATEKERRSKKRNERPLPSEEEKTSPARPTKRIKSVVYRQKKVAALLKVMSLSLILLAILKLKPLNNHLL